MTARLRRAPAREAPLIAAILSDWIDETPRMGRIHDGAGDRRFGAFPIENFQVCLAATRRAPVAVREEFSQ